MKNRSIISELFYGINEYKTQCLGCKKFIYNFGVESFVDFPLKQVNKYCLSKGLRKNNDNNNKNPDINLYECFDYYGKTELLNGDNQWWCNICRKLCDAFYSTCLYSTPQYLIINLNRGNGAVYKCNVIFPEKLNLLNFVSCKEGNTYYELYAVISFFGNFFKAFCKNNIDKKWYKYNDAMVNPCNKKDEYKDGIPCILFYQAL